MMLIHASLVPAPHVSIRPITPHGRTAHGRTARAHSARADMSYIGIGRTARSPRMVVRAQQIVWMCITWETGQNNVYI